MDLANDALMQDPLEDDVPNLFESSAKIQSRTRSLSKRSFPDHSVLVVVGGIVLPIACLIGDPFVFSASGQGILRGCSLFVYTFTGMEIVALCVWLAVRNRLGEWNGMAAGIFFIGAVLSAGLGVLLLPFSLLGLLILVGIWGFIPFFTAVVYFRAGVVAMAQARGNGRTYGKRRGVCLEGQTQHGNGQPLTQQSRSDQGIQGRALGGYFLTIGACAKPIRLCLPSLMQTSWRRLHSPRKVSFLASNRFRRRRTLGFR